jgi:hypothetical protein
MAKKDYEVAAKDLFLRHLDRERGEKWEVSSQDVVTDPKTRRDFDYELRFGSNLIALEIMRLVMDRKSLAKSVASSEFSRAFGAELKRRGVKDFIIWIPSFSVSKAHLGQLVQEAADKVEVAARSCTRELKLRIDGRIYTLTPSPGIGQILFMRQSGAGTSDPRWWLPQLESFLRTKLPDKNRQLSVQGHERVVLIVSLEGEMIVDTEDFQTVISEIDLSCFANIDKIYFGSGMEQVYLMYDRIPTKSPDRSR